MLELLRVLDLTNERGQLCGQMLADLGAEVILVEPPDGSSARTRGPFAGDIVDGERSLWFWSYNRGKRSITIDLETDAGRERLRHLAAEADFLVESFAPGYLDGLGLGYGALSGLNPRLIVVSITPFGSTGPKAGWAASDLTVMASSGVTQITGDEDRAPVSLRIPQGFLHCAADAAVGALIAHEARHRTGRGQHVDASAQASAMMATQALALAHGLGDTFPKRVSGGLKLGPILLKLVNPAKDGFVSVTFLFGSSIGPFTRRLAHLMHERGFMDEASRDKDWLNYTVLLQTGKEPISELMRLIGLVADFTRAHTKQELFDLALERGLLIVPVSTIDDIAHSPQLADRGYWTAVPQAGSAEPISFPGPFAKLHRTPIVYGAGAPALGQHDAEPFAGTWPARLDSPVAETSAGALGGLKVLDLMWVFAGPTATRSFADHGATVIRVESSHAIDAARTINPAKDGIAGPERAGGFINVNAGKLGITVNMGTAEGRALIRRLARWADVVMESFSPKAMRKWGLDYDTLRQENPGLIMLSSCLNGQTGPWAGLAGFGTMGAQLAGFGELAGWPDRPPAGMFGAYTDYVAPKFTAAVVLAAVEERRRSGVGQYIDFSQAESSLHFIAPAFLDYFVNRRVMRRNGNASDWWAPQGLYPCLGDDRWVAIVCETDAQWAALCQATGHQDWLLDQRFATNEGRMASREALDDLIGEWTAARTQAAVEETLQAAGVPAHRSAVSEDLFADPQLVDRGHFVEVDHGELGRVTIEHSRFQLSATPAVVTRGGATMGQDNDFVLREILGLDDDEIVELIAAGALE